jgi:bacterioferritin-associated ferredoxin
MIICSCNVLTDERVKEYLKSRETKPSVGTILKDLDCGPVCGTCSNNIIALVREHYGNVEITTDDPISSFIQRNGKYCHL